MRHPLLVLHDLGEERGGAPWREALVRDTWGGAWSAPDQPGHGEAHWEADYYEVSHLAMAPFRHLLEAGWRERPVVLGVGASARVAEFLGLGGKAAAVVLAGEPEPPVYASADERQRAEYAWLRSLADDPAAQAAAPYGRTDPRTRHGLAPHSVPGYRARLRAAMPVPVLELETTEPAEVIATVREWWAAVGEGR